MKSQLITDVSSSLLKNSPAILTGLGITGFAYTAYLMIDAVRKADNMLEDHPYKGVPFEVAEKTRIVAPAYLPPIGMGLVSVACILGSHSIASRRTHALASLYAFTDRALKEYREVVKNNVSKRKNEEIEEDLANRRVAANPLAGQAVIFGASGGVTVLDSYSGRYFVVTNIEAIHAAVNVINRAVNKDMFQSLNEFYYELGMEPIGDGDNLGWDAGQEPLEVNFDAALHEGTKAVLVMDYNVTHRWTNSHS